MQAEPPGFAFASSTQAGGADFASDKRLDRPVTLRCVASPATKALAALAAASGVPMRASGAIKSEILLLRLEGPTLREAMRRIASACAGSWALVDGTYLLERTDADEAAREAAATAFWETAMRAGLAKLAKRHAKLGPFDAAAATALAKRSADLWGTDRAHPGAAKYEDMLAATSQQPAGRFADAMLAQCDPKFLATLSSPERQVFSTSPTAMERPIKLDWTAAAEEYLRTQASWTSAVASLPESDAMQVQGLGYSKLAAGRPAKVNIAFASEGMEAQLTATVELLSTDGATMLHFSTRIEGDRAPYDASAWLAKAGERKLTISPEEMQVMSAIAAPMGGKVKSAAISADVRRKLAATDANEPLAGVASDLLLQAGDELKLNEVADLPDFMFLVAGLPASTGPLTAPSLFRALASLPTWLCPYKSDAGWYEMDGAAPPKESPFAFRDERLPLAALLAPTEGRPGIEALAAYAAATPQFAPHMLLMALTMALNPTTRLEGQATWDTLRTLGLAMASRGGSTVSDFEVPVSALDRATVEQLTYNTFYRTGNVGPYYVGEARDVCESLPNGLPGEARFSVRTTSEPVAFSVKQPFEGLTAEELASDTAAARQGAAGADADALAAQYPTTADQFRFGARRTVTLLLQLGATQLWQGTFYADEAGDGEPGPYVQLPSDFRDRVAKAQAAYGTGGK